MCAVGCVGGGGCERVMYVYKVRVFVHVYIYVHVL